MKVIGTSQVEFDWFGSRVEVRADSPELTAMVSRLLASASPGGPAEGPPRLYTVEIKGDGPPMFRGPDGTVPLDPALRVYHAYNLLVTDLLGRVEDHFAFHATSVARNGKGVIVSGPSTFGKTTLAVHLTARGFGLLADDVTFVHRRTRRILPFRRFLNLREGTRVTLPPKEFQRAASATREVVGEEWAVDPDRWLGGAPEPCPPAMVIILRPGQDAGRTRTFPFYEIRLMEGCGEERTELLGLPGIRDAKPHPRDPWLVYLEVREAAALARWLNEHQDRLVFAVKHPASPPEFEGEPTLEKTGTFQAALELCQEMLNRHEGSRIAEEFRGRESLLVTEAAGLLKEADCYALYPGRLERTLELIQGRFEEIRA